jgi:cold shock CspA family protein
MANTVYKGVLKTWKDDRGFGFIQPDNGDKDVFIHISSLKKMARRPQRGDTIFYELAQDSNGKFKAINAVIEGVEVVERGQKNLKWLWLIAVVLGLVTAAVAAYFM